jgi:hypothetical protein
MNCLGSGLGITARSICRNNCRRSTTLETRSRQEQKLRMTRTITQILPVFEKKSRFDACDGDEIKVGITCFRPIVEIGSGLANTFAAYRRTEPRRLIQDAKGKTWKVCICAPLSTMGCL